MEQRFLRLAGTVARNVFRGVLDANVRRYYC